MPVAVHTGDTATPAAKLRYAHPLTVDEVAADFPDVQFVICHCGNPWLLDATEVATKNDNVAVDLSGLLEGIPGPHFYRQNQGYFDYLGMWLRYMNRWDKLMYGSDWPLINIPDYIAIMRQLIPEEHQEAFFAMGPSHLVPLTMAELAGQLDIHESTVSRAVSKKYLQCSWGVYPMSYFFSRRVGNARDSGSALTASRIQDMMEEIIRGEDKKKPYSDRILAEKLNDQGVSISRRTVAKYREERGIGDATSRKEYEID